MADFELIDTKRFLKSQNSLSKTSRTPLGGRDEETNVPEAENRYQRNPAEPLVGSLGEVSLGDPLDPQSESIAVPDAHNSFAGFAGPIEGNSIQKGVKLEGREDTIPRLPFALERLVSAASGNLLMGFTFDGVPDINRYVMAWACAYLVGGSKEARDRLQQVQIAREMST